MGSSPSPVAPSLHPIYEMSHGAWSLSAIAFLVLCGVMYCRLRGARGALAAAKRGHASIQRDVAGLERLNAQLQEDQEFLTSFLREFLHVTQGLHSGVKERQIPRVILSVVLRSLEPRGIIVLVRRLRAETDPDRDDRLVVAATHGASLIAVGTEVRVGHGELGFVAEAQQVMNRQDLEAVPASRRLRLKEENPQGLDVDLVAPMIFGDDTLGLIALSGCRRTSESAKAVLWLIAQTGAQAIQNASAYSQMKTKADVDGLTKVFNKRHMTNTLAECLFEASQRLSKLSVFLLDIDNFKNYNDVNGHGAGDRLLQELARLVQENIRKDDIFGRFGGEEFLLILPGANLGQAMAVAYKVRAAIAAHDFPFAKGQPLGVLSISGGVAEYPEDAMDSARLLQAADEALYLAKQQGRNRVLPAERRYLGDGEPEVGGRAGPLVA
jgi:diguanylate cyclase (GGDEF)-like protein